MAFLIGLAIFLYPLLAAYVNYSKDSSAVDNYDQIVDALSPAQRRAMWRDAKKYDEELGKPTLRDPFKYKEVKEPLGRYYKILNVDGKGMMAYVEIPKINVKLPVRHGTSDEVLKDGTGHIATTHVPTDNRTIHSVITGHTGEVGYMLFDNLTQLRKGDVFQIRVLKRHMSYKVDQIKIILPTDVSALQPIQNSNYVTLLTCYPYGVNSHRLIVRGHYIGDDVPPTQPEGAPIYMVWVLLALFLACLVGWYLLSRRRRNCRHELEQMEHLESRATGPGTMGEPLATIMVSHEQETRSEATRRRRLIKTRRICSAFMWLLAVLGLFFAWGTVGMMMKISLLPVFDLGYHWFDTHVLYFFSISKI
ncbi:class C sortase [Bifidobacterium sp. W8101]|uniref:class C sortase n=1 Tax=Bifidobacterium TaxID=1678 RepID=UPI0018A22970|nr:MULTISPECIES: class C sortase [Bifidobacterium]MBI0125879.1 class C sortase [Bifidobacterium choladohabitans]MBI0127448.1 class C sortase [Bifidobacterium sp. W8103]MBI0138036.1 class C sortase [Bifidobacterium sp. W8105]MBI0148993.1 class C sortase [Bifidobacterium sp. W8107]